MTPAAVARSLLRTIEPRFRQARSSPITSRRRSARNVILCGFALIVLAFLAMAVAVETVRPEWRDPEYGHRLKQLRELQRTHPNRPLVVAVGSSRTQMGLSPAAMDLPDEAGSPLVYNFGQSGAGPLHILLTVQRLLDDGIKPDYFLIELLPATLSHDGSAEQHFEKILPRLTRADLRRIEPYTRNPARLRMNWAATRANSWYEHRLSLMSHWQQNWLPVNSRVTFHWQQMDEFGFAKYPFESVSDDYRDSHFERGYTATLRKLRIGGMADRVFRDLVARCRTEHIPVAFFLMPESPRFQEMYSLETRATIAGYREMLKSELRTPVFDAASGFAEDEFADGHHLLRHGAASFSRRLFSECLLPWLRAAK